MRTYQLLSKHRRILVISIFFLMLLAVIVLAIRFLYNNNETKNNNYTFQAVGNIVYINNGGLYKYENDKLVPLSYLDKGIESFGVVDGNLLYSTKDGLYLCDMTSKKSRRVQQLVNNGRNYERISEICVQNGRGYFIKITGETKGTGPQVTNGYEGECEFCYFDYENGEVISFHKFEYAGGLSDKAEAGVYTEAPTLFGVLDDKVYFSQDVTNQNQNRSYTSVYAFDMTDKVERPLFTIEGCVGAPYLKIINGAVYCLEHKILSGDNGVKSTCQTKMYDLNGKLIREGELFETTDVNLGYALGEDGTLYCSTFNGGLYVERPGKEAEKVYDGYSDYVFENDGRIFLARVKHASRETSLNVMLPDGSVNELLAQ